jgi:hypothetical protein
VSGLRLGGRGSSVLESFQFHGVGLSITSRLVLDYRVRSRFSISVASRGLFCITIDGYEHGWRLCIDDGTGEGNLLAEEIFSFP